MQGERIGSWFQAAGARDGQLGGNEAASFLKRTGLSNNILANIWNVADPNGRGFLDSEGFYRSLRAASLAQQGVDPQQAWHVRPDTVPAPSVSGFDPPPEGWPIPSQGETAERERIWSMYGAATGFVDGNQAPQVVNEAGGGSLRKEKLAQAWQLSDWDGDGRLDREQWSAFLYLVKCASGGLELPSRLPFQPFPPQPAGGGEQQPEAKSEEALREEKEQLSMAKAREANKRNELELERDGKSQEVRRLEQERDRLKQALDGQSGEVQGLRDEITELERQRESLTQEVERLRNTPNKSVQENYSRQLREEVAALRQEVDSMQSQASGAEVERLQAEQASLQQRKNAILRVQSQMKQLQDYASHHGVEQAAQEIIRSAETLRRQAEHAVGRGALSFGASDPGFDWEWHKRAGGDFEHSDLRPLDVPPSSASN